MTTYYATRDWAGRISAVTTNDPDVARRLLDIDQAYGVESELVVLGSRGWTSVNDGALPATRAWAP